MLTVNQIIACIKMDQACGRNPFNSCCDKHETRSSGMGEAYVEPNWLDFIDYVKLVGLGADAILEVCDHAQIGSGRHPCVFVMRGKLETPADVRHWLFENAVSRRHAFEKALEFQCALGVP